jgi:hypothetical protein
MSAARIAAALAGHPVKGLDGNYSVCCPAHDDDNPSLSLRDGPRGLIVHCFTGCAPQDIYRAIRTKGIKIDQADAPVSAPSKSVPEHRRRQAEKAAWLWSKRHPIAGSIAERYLREARKYSGPLQASLGFLPPLKPEQHPAMIAAFGPLDDIEPGVLGKAQHVTAIHLTLLKPDGSGKEEVETPKLTIGSPLGKPIVLAPPNDLLGLTICEGIEDALTAHQATGLGAWAAGSAPFMPALAEIVPDYITAVTIYAHPDKGQRFARELADALRRRKPREGERPVEIRVEGLS